MAVFQSLEEILNIGRINSLSSFRGGFLNPCLGICLGLLPVGTAFILAEGYTQKVDQNHLYLWVRNNERF